MTRVGRNPAPERERAGHVPARRRTATRPRSTRPARTRWSPAAGTSILAITPRGVSCTAAHGQPQSKVQPRPAPLKLSPSVVSSRSARTTSPASSDASGRPRERHGPPHADRTGAAALAGRPRRPVGDAGRPWACRSRQPGSARATVALPATSMRWANAAGRPFSPRLDDDLAFRAVLIDVGQGLFDGGDFVVSPTNPADPHGTSSGQRARSAAEWPALSCGPRASRPM